LLEVKSLPTKINAVFSGFRSISPNFDTNTGTPNKSKRANMGKLHGFTSLVLTVKNPTGHKSKAVIFGEIPILNPSHSRERFSTYPTNREVRKIIDSKVPAGWGMLCSQKGKWNVSQVFLE